MENWITAIASSITAIGIFILVYQLCLQRRIWQTDHERSRKEKAIEVVKDYTQSANQSWAAARMLVDKLGENECKKLFAGERLELEIAHKDLLLAIIPLEFDESSIDEHVSTITLNERQVFALRWQAVSFLNAVEIVLQAWARSVADKEIIENEMKFLYQPAQGLLALEKFRTCCGGRDAYPAIGDFVAYMRMKDEAQLPDRPIVASD